MTTHELAAKLLELPDQEVCVGVNHICFEIVRIDRQAPRETDLREHPRAFYILVGKDIVNERI